MHILIISATPHSIESSNTNKLIKSFEKGITEIGSTANIMYLNQRKEWANILQLFSETENIVFALPVYVGNVPSIFKEFIELLYQNYKKSSFKNKKVSYILQSGYPEASQRECCEKYLESFTNYLGCLFGGILSHGIDYGMIENVSFEQTVSFYREFGKEYVLHNATFFFEKAEKFNGSYNLTEEQAKKFTRYFNFFCKHNSEEIGTLSRLYDTPLMSEDSFQ